MALDWATTERERLLSKFLLSLDHLGQILVMHKDLEQAVDVFQSAIARDPYREDIHAHLIRCYVDMGQRASAIKQFERCRSVLKAELGIEPMQETRALLAQAGLTNWR